jgi:predicted transposase YdaD
VRSVAVILNKASDSPSLNGHHRVLLPDGTCYLDFRYSVVRVWKLDVKHVLQSGLGILPLAPLAKFNKKEVRTVIDRMKVRLDREVSQQEAALLWAATQVLMGLRYPVELIEALVHGVQGMEESVMYQAILSRGEAKGKAKGVVEGEQKILLFLGTKRLGEPSPEIVKKVEAITEEATVWKLADRIFDVSTWDELLSIP